jgi:hypothetical protein
MRLAVIHHSTDRAASIGRTLFADFCAAFQAAGHDVVHVRGTAAFEPADAALLHVNVSVVPDGYVAFGGQYPILLNGRITDIRKRRVSQARIRLGEGYDGPVIVKTDLNHGGVPERARLPFLQSLAMRLGISQTCGRGLEYPVFDSPGAVPARLRENRNLVVEKFLPEREGDFYFVRQAYFLGDRAISWRIRSNCPIVRADSASDDVEIPTSPAVDCYRRQLGLDYGKVDYVEHGGEVVVLDVNKTMGGRGTAPVTVARLAPGLMEALRAEPVKRVGT